MGIACQISPFLEHLLDSFSSLAAVHLKGICQYLSEGFDQDHPLYHSGRRCMASYPWLRGGPPARPAQATRAVRLQKIHSPPENESRTYIDIIAIHGLDTNSEETWVWDPKGDNVNWLKQSDMLPEKFPSARIFTCDWPADLFEESDFIQKEFEEFARLLLAGIKHRPQATAGGSDKAGERPIVFIASCLGGVILMKALVMASHEYQCVKQATRGIIFLATPFRGTSFEDVAKWAEPGLSAWASIRGKKISNLLELVKSSFNLGELVRSFTALCQENDLANHIVIFYETGKSSLLRKVAFWLPQYLAQEKPVRPLIYFLSTHSENKEKFSNPHQLVDISSATLDIVKHPLALDRPHVLMNKFSGPHDPDYEIIAERIDYLFRKIRQGRAIERADVWIRTKRYSLKELKIERLSGELLPMDRCYINLALVEHSGVSDNRAEEDDASQKASPFSLFARLKTERPDESMEVALPTLFEPRQARDGQMRRPNRILVRGRAGVGKTTLCKKIVHDFTSGGMWQDLFDRVLWLPLRNLKRRRSSAYNFGSLFYDEYFSQHPQGKDLANALWSTLLQTTSERTLFILDGLDEVVEDLEGDMLIFFTELLDQPNVIITSRPHTMLPPGIEDVDLHLETIGFYPDQLKTYVENAFTDPKTGQIDFKTVAKIQSYLQQHPLVEGLVRIPVVLDALCFTWEDFIEKDVPRTMTAVYQSIEDRLWRKDAVKLEKLTKSQALGARPREITSSISDQRHLLQHLAFTGIYNDVIEFEPKHCDAILDGPTFTGKNFLLNETLKCLSFLRTSDPLLGSRDQSYHFLHLTFQEYFAARYFVRQWKANRPLEYIMFGDGRSRGSKPANLDPSDFLQRNKYKSRYDIFWRFVAGLLNEEGGEEASQFLKAIEAEPFDILGPMHQRLVMHCLSEIQTEITFRNDLEERLFQWLLFECKYTYHSSLATEMEFPVSVLLRALRESPKGTKFILLRSLQKRPGIESDVLELVASVLEDDNSNSYVRLLVLDVLRHGTGVLSDRVVNLIAGQLGDPARNIRLSAVESLAGQSALLPNVLEKVAALLADEDRKIREAAIRVLTDQSAITQDSCQSVAAQLEKTNWYLGQDVLAALADELAKLAISQEMAKRLSADLANTNWCLEEQDVLAALADELAISQEMAGGLSAEFVDEEWRSTVSLERLKTTRRLAGKFGFTPETLKEAAARLEHTVSLERLKTVRRLAGKFGFTPETLKEVAARLEHTDWRVRQATVEVLGGQLANVPEMVEKVAARLTDEDEGVRWAAAQVFSELAEPLETIGPYLDSFCWAYLSRSFQEPVTWLSVDGFSYVTVGEREVSLGRFPWSLQRNSWPIGSFPLLC